jgi:hypothetical protein
VFPRLASPRYLAAFAGLLWLSAGALKGQTFDPTPAFRQDLAAQFPLRADFSTEQQIQGGTQGSSTNGNPLAYGHGLQFRPWLHYDGIPLTTLTGSVSYLYYFTVPGTSFFRHPEWRYTLMGTLKQSLAGGSLYEQLRAELLNFRDSHGAVQHLPRARVRFGQNVYLGERGWLNKPYFGVFEEAILQLPRPSYSHVTFSSGRLFAGFGFESRSSRADLLFGIKAEAEASSSGSTVTLFFGPAFSLRYNFRRDHPMHQNHQRTAAFRDF